MKGELQGEVLDSENEVGLPEPLVGLVGQVGPGDRRQGGYEQEQGAETGLGHRGDLLGDGVTPTWTNRTLSRRAVDRGGLRGSAPSTTISERKGRSIPPPARHRGGRATGQRTQGGAPTFPKT